MRRALVLAAVVAGLFVVGRADSAPLLPCSGACPDLVVLEDRLLDFSFLDTQTFTELDCEWQEGALTGLGERKLFRFTTSVFNRGRGPLHVGNPADHPELFSFDNCHGHPHWVRFVDYRLWSEQGWKGWQALKRGSKLPPAELLAAHPEIAPVTGNKMGFCVADIQPLRHGQPVDFEDPLWDTQFYSGCDLMGLSPSWNDAYYPELPLQWVDVTGLSGTFRLEVDLNPLWLIEESSLRNNSATVEVTIP